MKKKILLLGANGMAGHVLTIYFRNLQQEYSTFVIARNDSIIKPDQLLDVTCFDELKKVIDTLKPNFIINAIGVLNQNAEKLPANAILINSYLPHFLELVTTDTAIKVIHISTDCVFSGKKGNYIESDIKDGKGYYGQSKALGELNNEKDITLRTSIIGPDINPNGIGLFHWFMKQQGSILGYTKSIWSGVTTLELAKAVHRSIEKHIAGIYHITNGEKINKNELLKLFNKYTNKNIDIIEVDGVFSDKSLIDTRKEFVYQVPSYEVMVNEMIEFIIHNKTIYSQY